MEQGKNELFCRNVIGFYGCGYSDSKELGFNMGYTRDVGYLRIKKLLVLPVIIFCCSHKVSKWKHDCVLTIKN